MAMTLTEIQESLDLLGNLKKLHETLLKDKQTAIDSVYTYEIKGRVVEIENQFNDKTKELNDNIAILESNIRESVSVFGASVRTKLYIATYQKGRVSWDTKSLDDYTTSHPELSVFRRVGKPIVSLRAQK